MPWLKAELAHTLRMLELIGRTDIPVAAGAEYPLVRRKDETELWEQQYGSFVWLGAWTPRLYHPPDQLGKCPKATHNQATQRRCCALPRAHGTEVSPRDHYLRRWTDDESGSRHRHRSEFPTLAKELIFMGASLNPKTMTPNSRIPRGMNSTCGLIPKQLTSFCSHRGQDRLHDSRHLRKNTTDAELDRSDQSSNAPAAKYIASYAQLRGNTTICGMNWQPSPGLIQR